MVCCIQKDMEMSFMLKFLVILPFRILFLPILLFLKIVFWICSGLLCMTEWVFGLASRILLLVIAFLISPYGGANEIEFFLNHDFIVGIRFVCNPMLGNA